MARFRRNSGSTNQIATDDEEEVDLDGYNTRAPSHFLYTHRFPIVFIIAFVLLIVEIVFITLANRKVGECEANKNNQCHNWESDICGYSEEAQRVKLEIFLRKLVDEYYEILPEETMWHPNVTDVYIRQNFKFHDPQPENIKRITDKSMILLKEANDLNPNLSLLKPREHKSYLRVIHFLENNFGKPNQNFYTGLWLMGPSSFCSEPICYHSYKLHNALSLTPKSVEDVEWIVKHLRVFNRTIYDYIDVLKLGIKKGMVRTQAECRAGVDAIKSSHLNISKHGAIGVKEEWYTAKLYNETFFVKITSDMQDYFLNKYNKSAMRYVHKHLEDNVGDSIQHLLDYLEFDHYLYCRPNDIGAAGLAALPIDVIYYKGLQSANWTDPVLPLCNGVKCALNGRKAYEQVLGYYTTKEIHPIDVNKLGWENLKKLYPQIVEIAKNVTGQENTSLAIQQFKLILTNISLSYFHSQPLPENETRGVAFTKCTSADLAEKYCPIRWKAMMKWFEFAEMTMSKLDPKTVDLLYFTGERHSTPNCPVKLMVDFNPSSGAQSYESSDPECSVPCNYYIPFFLEHLGPVYMEYTTNAHEARPGHHTQNQGFNEHFLDKCGGPEGWLDDKSEFTAFEEGWGLYTENPLVAQSTDIYKNEPMQRFGMLKGQIWRAIRLIIDTGIHYKNMSRTEALKLFEDYAWDKTDLSEKEVTRYQSNNGQATAYMIGQLDIWSLRNITEEKLGDLYDIKEFHLQALSQGVSPLKYLESYINKYIECKLDSSQKHCYIVLNPTKANSRAEPSKLNKRFKLPVRRHYF